MAEPQQHAERDSDSPSGTGDGGEKVTVRIKPLPDEGARLKRQLEAALRGELGELGERCTHIGSGPFHDIS